ncbi:MAG: IS1595 family transposase, partial [Methyloceanibacter sp.]
KNKHVSKRKRGNIGGQGKEIAFALVERGGKVRSFHVPEVSAKTLRPILLAQVSRKSILVTDDAGQYRHMGQEFAGHEVVNHGGNEYVRGDAHTNTIEGYFSILKRGIVGTCHHVSQQHLKRYLAEFDFRYNERSALGINDAVRADKLLKGIVGKRLTASVHAISRPSQTLLSRRPEIIISCDHPGKRAADMAPTRTAAAILWQSASISETKGTPFSITYRSIRRVKPEFFLGERAPC